MPVSYRFGKRLRICLSGFLSMVPIGDIKGDAQVSALFPHHIIADNPDKSVDVLVDIDDPSDRVIAFASAHFRNETALQRFIKGQKLAKMRPTQLLRQCGNNLFFASIFNLAHHKFRQ